MPKMTHDDFDESAHFSPAAIHAAMAAAPPPPVLAAPSASGNPLAKFFRLPGLSVPLPTGGAYFPEGGVELTETGEVEIVPMRSQDEYLLSSPDALMNNTAILKLIESCVPSIKMPHMVSVPDLDVLLLAIRVASSGEEMEIELVCPKCEASSPFVIHIPSVLSTIKPMPRECPVRVNNEVVVYLRPHTVSVQTKLLMSAFQQSRRAQAAQAAGETISDDERGAIIADVMDKLSETNYFGIAHSIVKVVIPGFEVTDLDDIDEYIRNTDRNTFNKISKKLEALNAMGLDKSIEGVCSHCDHKWPSQIEFNPATFFEERSSD